MQSACKSKKCNDTVDGCIAIWLLRCIRLDACFIWMGTPGVSSFPGKHTASDNLPSRYHPYMRIHYSWIAAFAFLQLTAVSSQSSPDTRKCPVESNLADVWVEQNKHNQDVQSTHAPLTCKPVTLPSDNRLQAFSGKR